jgi:putative FmdB family regulatory protein
MPIYEYVCHACEKEFEAMQKFNEKPLTRCTCGKKGRVERKLSVPSFHLQGGGWYAEGYSGKKEGNGNGKSDAKGETKSAGTSSDGGASKSDTGGSKTEKKEAKKESKAAKAPAAATPA